VLRSAAEAGPDVKVAGAAVFYRATCWRFELVSAPCHHVRNPTVRRSSTTPLSHKSLKQNNLRS